jgi:holo-[acyl-carrier protein] synthase
LIAGIGTDIIEVEAVKKRLSEHKGLREDLFTDSEIAYCESKTKKVQHYAARFAAKEAFLKAMGTGLRDGMKFHDIEITNNELGKPSISLHGKTQIIAAEQHITSIHVSLAHFGNIANALVIIETQPN